MAISRNLACFPLRPDSVTRGFQRLLSRAGLPHMRFHDLRHATATILFDRGWSVSDVQHWPGHSDYDTTMNVYVAYCRSRPLTLGGALHGLFVSAEKGKRPVLPDAPEKEKSPKP